MIGLDTLTLILGSVALLLFFEWRASRSKTEATQFFWTIVALSSAVILAALLVNVATTNNATPTITNLSNYYFQHGPSDTAGFNYMNLSQDPISGTQMAVFSGTEAGIFRVANFITPAGEPGLKVLTSGIYQVHIHASSNGSAELFSQVWIMGQSDAGHNDNDIYMIGQTPLTHTLTLEQGVYTGSFYSNQSYSIPASDRVAVYIYANVTAFSVPLNVTIYEGGGANPHLTLPAQTTVIPAIANLGGLEEWIIIIALIVQVAFILIWALFWPLMPKWMRDQLKWM